MDKIFISQYKAYPLMEAEDAVCLAWESAFGGDAAGDEYDLMEGVENEGSALTADQLTRPWVEKIGGGYCRMNLSVLQALPAGLLAKMMIASRQPGIEDLYYDGIRAAVGAFPPEKTHTYMSTPPIKPAHSPAYLGAYSPAYRVVKEEFGNYIDLIVKISRLLYKTREVTVAIDGQSGAGKTTLSFLLSRLFDCNVFHTEDFMSRGEFDHRRFAREVCEKLNQGKAFTCGGKEISPKRLNIAEGPYCLHPLLEKYYEVKVFMAVSPGLQSERVIKRDGHAVFGRLVGELIPRENAYIEEQNVKIKCDLFYQHG